MASNSRIGLGRILPIVAVVLGLVSLIGLALDGITMSQEIPFFGKLEASIPFHNIVFGGTVEIDGVEMGNAEPTGMLVIGIIAILLGSLASIGAMRSRLIAPIIAGALLFVGAIICFCTVQLALGDDYTNLPNELKDVYKLGTGALLTGVLALAAAAIDVVSILFSRKAK